MTANWCWRDDVAEIRLMENALPLTVPDARVEAHWLSAKRVASLATSDLPVLFSRTVLADESALKALRAKFPGERAFSDVPLPGAEDACTSCRTSFGGMLVVARTLDTSWLWSGFDRAAILDALDAATTGRMAARLLTGGYCVVPIVRTDDAGRVKGVYLLNASPGETPSLKLSVRCPAGKRVLVRTVNGVHTPLQTRSVDGAVELTLPPMDGWRPQWIEFHERVTSDWAKNVMMKECEDAFLARRDVLQSEKRRPRRF